MSLGTYITRHFQVWGLLNTSYPYFSQVSVWPNRGRMKKRDGQREDFKQENVRSDAEAFHFKVPHLAFICWIPCLLHVLAAIFTSSRIWRSHVITGPAKEFRLSSHYFFFLTFLESSLNYTIPLNTHIYITIFKIITSTPQFNLLPPCLMSDKWLRHRKMFRECSEESGVSKEPLIQCPTSSVSNTCTAYSPKCLHTVIHN